MLPYMLSLMPYHMLALMGYIRHLAKVLTIAMPLVVCPPDYTRGHVCER